MRKLVLMLVLSFFTVSSYALSDAQEKQLAEIATTIAEQHNRNSKLMLNDMTVDTHAESIGKNVIFKYILNFKKDVSASKTQEIDAVLRAEIIPQSCKVNASNPAFDRGLFYAFAYFNEHTYQIISQFDVDKKVCNNIEQKAVYQEPTPTPPPVVAPQPVIPVYSPVKEQNVIQNAIVVAPTNVQVAEYKPEPKKKVKKYNLDPNLDLRYCLEIKNIVEFDKCVNQ